MTTNKLTPGSNMLWESSRMIIPEHREAILRAKHEEKRRSRPLFDDQYADEIGRALSEAHRAKEPVNIRMFDEYDDVRVIGVIERLDTQGRRFMVDGEWFRVADVLNVEEAP